MVAIEQWLEKSQIFKAIQTEGGEGDARVDLNICNNLY